MIRLSAIFLVVFSASVFARPVTITYEGVASGSLDGVSFTNVAFKIVGNADTETLVRRPPPSCYHYVVHISTSVALEGLGEFSLLTDGVGGHASTINGSYLDLIQFREGEILGASLVGISPAAACDTSSEPYVSNLLTAQTLSKSLFVSGWEDGGVAGPVMTDGGRLIFNNDNGNSQGSRTVSYPPAQPVPAMSIYLLVVLAGLLGLLGFCRVRASK